MAFSLFILAQREGFGLIKVQAVSLRPRVQKRPEKLGISWDWAWHRAADLLCLYVQAFDASHSYESYVKMCSSIPQGLQRMTQPASRFKMSQLPPDPGNISLPFSFIFPFFGQNQVEGDTLAALTLCFPVAQQ